MLPEILETKLDGVENNVRAFTLTVNDLTAIVHQIEVNMMEIKMIQQKNTEDIRRLSHDVKSLDAGWDTNYHKVYDDIKIIFEHIQDIKNRLFFYESQQKLNRKLFNDWERIFLFLFASLGCIGTIIEWFFRR